MKIVYRSDFIANYVGHSYQKTLLLLQAHMNEEIGIDESKGVLYYGEQDWFGYEAVMAIKDSGRQVGII